MQDAINYINIMNNNKPETSIERFIEELKKENKVKIKAPADDGKTYSVIYPRVSSLEQKSNFSLDLQKGGCEEYAHENKYEILAYFGGTNESAKTDDRVEFQKMLDFVKKSKKKIIILTYVFNRFSRTGEDAIDIIDELEAKYGVYVQSVKDPIAIGTLRGRIHIEKALMEGKHENQLRYESCRGGIDANLQSGGWNNSVAFGYYWEYPPREKKRIIKVDHDKARIIVDMFNWFVLENLTYREIRERLLLIGLDWSIQNIARKIRNPFYIGLIKHAFLKGQVVKGTHEPILPLELFMAARDRINGNHHGYVKIHEKENTALKGFCRCEKCNYGLSFYQNNKKTGKDYTYYRCQNKCSGVIINVNTLNEAFKEELHTLALDPALKPLVKKQLHATFEAFSTGNERQEKLLRCQLTEKEKEFLEIKKNFAIGKINQELFDDLSPGYNASIDEIKAELEKISFSTPNLENKVDQALELTANLLNFYNLLSFKKKTELQDLVFPTGMTFMQNSERLLTGNVNPVFTEISRLSRVSEEVNCGEGISDAQNTTNLYNTFPTPNSLGTAIEALARFYEEVKYYLTVTPVPVYTEPIYTGKTQSVQYNYVSGSTVVADSATTMDNHVQYILPVSSGGTQTIQQGGQA